MDYAQVMQNWHDQPYKDRERDLKMQQMLQQLTENATKDREAAEDRRRAMLGAAKGIDTLSGLDTPPTAPPGAPAAPPVAPPTAGMPPPTASAAPPSMAQPAPGQSSAPMQRPAGPAPGAVPPGAPPPMPNAAQNAADPAARALMMKLAQGGPAQVKVSPQGAISGTPPGWKPSPAAGPALGGAGPAMGGSPAPGAGATPTPPPPTGAPGAGGPMAGIDKSQMIDPKDFIAKAIKGGATPMEAFDQYSQMKPVIDAHNNQIIKDFGAQAKIAAQTIAFQRQKLAEYRAQESLQVRKDSLAERTKYDQARIDRAARGGTGAGAPNLGHLNVLRSQESKELEPVTQAESAIQDIRGLISTADSASRPQVQKLLASFLQRGPRTNAMYADVASAGGLYDRLSNSINKWYAGDYSDANKKMILSMMDQMESKVFAPYRQRIEKGYKDLAKRYGYNPDDLARASPVPPEDAGAAPDTAPAAAAPAGLPQGWSVKVIGK